MTGTSNLLHLGETFGRLSLVEIKDICGFNVFICKCKCGKLKGFSKRQLLLEHVKSCGCLHTETAQKQGYKNATHGAKRNKQITAEYRAWCGLKNRCLNSKDNQYYRYGGRGIWVCGRWKDSFVNFLSDMGKRPSSKHSLDRINNDGPYEPSNCRWATYKEQANNRHYARPGKPYHVKH